MTTAMAERALDAFRTITWPQIRHDLRQEKGIPPAQAAMLDSGVEPTWKEPGKAVLWQFVTIGLATPKPIGWEQVVVPITTGSQLAAYLRLGFCLRSPEESVEAVEAVSPAAPPMAEAQHPVYTCDRHPRRGRFGFKTWDGYLAHCQHFKEMPEGDPPRELLERAKAFPFFCFLHNAGFKSLKAATQHYMQEVRRWPLHPTIDQMQTASAEEA